MHIRSDLQFYLPLSRVAQTDFYQRPMSLPHPVALDEQTEIRVAWSCGQISWAP